MFCVTTIDWIRRVGFEEWFRDPKTDVQGKFPQRRVFAKLPGLKRVNRFGMAETHVLRFRSNSNIVPERKGTIVMAKSTRKVPATKAASEEQVMLDNALGQIEKMFGKGSIMKLDSNENAGGFPGISTGALSLDLALGGHGFPRGRIIELFGPESSGKTTLALHAIASAQKAGGIAAFVDAEHALDPQWARKLGVNMDELLVSQPSY